LNPETPKTRRIRDILRQLNNGEIKDKEKKRRKEAVVFKFIKEMQPEDISGNKDILNDSKQYLKNLI
jgi:hypothetical protein